MASFLNRFKKRDTQTHIHRYTTRQTEKVWMSNSLVDSDDKRAYMI